MKNILCIFLIIVSIFLVSCNNKKSILGFSDSNFNTYDITLPDSCITLAYTWSDSLKNYSENSKLLLGNFDNTDIRTLIKFPSIPVIANETDIIDSTIKIKIKVKEKLYTQNFDMEVYLLTKTWYENEPTWNVFRKDSTWTTAGGDLVLPMLKTVSFTTVADTLIFSIQPSVIYGWGEDANTNKGLLLKSALSGINHLIEMYSSESAYAPTLQFSYIPRDENGAALTTATYKKSAIIDTYIHNGTESFTTDNTQLSLWNIQPKSMVMKFNLPLSVFQSAAPEIQTADDLKKVTINRANLVFIKKNDNLPNTETAPSIGVGIYQEPVVDQNIFVFSKIDFFSVSSESFTTDTLAVKITGPIQSLISQLKNNNGLIIRSNYKNRDFNRLNFYTINDPDPTKRPKIRIKFSTLKE